MMRIRAFRAIEDLETCRKYSEGHSKVLSAINVRNVSGTDEAWFSNPGIFGIIVESIDRQKVYGGAKIQIHSENYPLPIEEAIGDLDPNIHKLVKEKSKEGTGELCGLWNSREVAGMGIGSIILVRACVARAGVVIAEKLKLNSLFAFCASYTLPMAQRTGFEIEESIGNKGTFAYPKPDLLAYVTILNDVKKLNQAKPVEKKHIMDLREHPFQKKIERGPKGQIEVEYILDL